MKTYFKPQVLALAIALALPSAHAFLGGGGAMGAAMEAAAKEQKAEDSAEREEFKKWQETRGAEKPTVEMARKFLLMDHLREMHMDFNFKNDPFVVEFIPYWLAGRLNEIEWNERQLKLLEARRLDCQAAVNRASAAIDMERANSRFATVDPRTGQRIVQGAVEADRARRAREGTCHGVREMISARDASIGTRIQEKNRLEIE